MLCRHKTKNDAHVVCVYECIKLNFPIPQQNVLSAVICSTCTMRTCVPAF